MNYEEIPDPIEACNNNSDLLSEICFLIGQYEEKRYGKRLDTCYSFDILSRLRYYLQIGHPIYGIECPTSAGNPMKMDEYESL